MEQIKLVFDGVRNTGSTLNNKKREYAAAELDYLGQHVELGKVEPKRQMVAALLDFPKQLIVNNCNRF